MQSSEMQEKFFTKTVEKCMSLMSQRLLMLYKPDESAAFDELKWVKQLRKCIKAIQYMEKGKSTKIATEPLTALSQQLKLVFVSRRHYFTGIG